MAQVAESTQGPARATQPGQEKTASGSFLDPDVPFVLFLAIVTDILDVLLVGVLVNFILGPLLILWMVWKTGQIQTAKEQGQRMRQGPQERAAFRARQQERLAQRKAATRRLWKRGALYFLGGLVPILSIFVLWTWAVIKTVRGK